MDSVASLAMTLKEKLHLCKSFRMNTQLSSFHAQLVWIPRFTRNDMAVYAPHTSHLILHLVLLFNEQGVKKCYLFSVLRCFFFIRRALFVFC